MSLHGRAAGGVEFRKVTLSYSAVSMTWFPVKIAVEKGFFRSEGLEPQLIQMNGNVATVALAEDKIRKDPDLIKRVIRASGYRPN
ncbi:MAG: hypothetical protein Q7J56_01225 [Deltaproteobacteria bacterium]|nr:hypothetical protein [Deltaproteobacteria bacterium]